MTQNFVSSINLRHVLRFLATENEELISGCPVADRGSLNSRFLAALQKQCPEVRNQPHLVKQEGLDLPPSHLIHSAEEIP